jgi:NhaA family Na+:H+ antiporter
LGRALRSSFRPIPEFLRAESVGGILLGTVTLAALVWANFDPSSYDSLWSYRLDVGLETLALRLDARHWVNDAAMAVFFFVVGLELKREFVDGELRRPRQAALPIFAAAGGMVVPAALYLVFNRDTDAARGWGVPMATDIAFAIGVLTLFGRRIAHGLKVFLLSVAIMDDIGAVAVIALFYSTAVDAAWLLLAILAFAAFWGVWRSPAGRSRSPVAMVLPVLAVAAWIATHGSGIHATIAGVVLGFLVPAARRPLPSPAERLERALHPWTSLLIVPLFALANAGIALGLEPLQAALAAPISIGVFVGLVVGKPIGIAMTVYVALTLKIAKLPDRVTRLQILGVGALGGIGFTVSLFITQLAFVDAERADSAKIAVLAASIVAAALGYGLLRVGTTQVRSPKVSARTGLEVTP